MPISARGPRDRLIVAIDAPALRDALRMVRQLHGLVRWFKIGSILFTAAGPEAVRRIRARGGAVFLDLKFHDIPTTVAKACAAATRLHVAMLTLHVQGGRAMLQAARAAVDAAASGASHKPLLIGVTRLTSDGGASSATVVRLARVARAARLDGVVAPPAAVRAVRRACGRRFVIVSPGIRLAGDAADDHAAPASAAQALRHGASFLVVGRPVTEARRPRAAAQQLIDDMERAYGS